MDIRLFVVYWRGPDRDVHHGYVYTDTHESARKYYQERLQEGYHVTHVYYAHNEPLPGDILFTERKES